MMFIAPYVTACWPHPVDCYDFYTVLGDNVPAYKDRNESSAVVAMLAYDIVKPIPEAGKWEDPFIKVVLHDGREAYVERKKTRSAIGCRAYFVKRDGAWGLWHFIAGD